MGSKETIRRILKEELQDINIEIHDVKHGVNVLIMMGDEKIGEIVFEDNGDNNYTIVDANIHPDYRGKGLYRKAIISVFDEKPNAIINSVFRSPEADRAWQSLISKLPNNIEHKTKYYREEKTRLHQLMLKKGINESYYQIRRNFHKLPNYVRSTYGWLNPKSFNDFDDFLQNVIWRTIRDFVADFRESSWEYKDYEDAKVKLNDTIKNIIVTEYYDEIFEYYKKMGGYLNKKIEESYDRIRRRLDMNRMEKTFEDAIRYYSNSFKNQKSHYFRSSYLTFKDKVMHELMLNISAFFDVDKDLEKFEDRLYKHFHSRMLKAYEKAIHQSYNPWDY